MATIKATLDGEEREFELLRTNQLAMKTTHYLDGTGEGVKEYKTYQHSVRAPMRENPTTYLRLIGTRHEFGGVVYEEGERREAVRGEWFMYDNDIYPHFCVISQTQIVTILRLVSGA